MRMSLLLAAMAGVVAVAPALARADFNLPDPDVTPPTVEITEPTDGQQFDDASMYIDVLVDAVDLPGPRSEMTSGISTVWLEVDGVDGGPDQTMPYAFSLMLEPGAHTIRAHATDYEGNTGDSAVVTITVAGTLGTTGGTGGTGDTGVGTSTGPLDTSGDAGPVGCVCELAASHPINGVLALLLLGCRRRRAAGGSFFF